MSQRLGALALLALLGTRPGWCSSSDSQVPPWVQAQVGAALPEHDDETNAVTLYASQAVVVQPNGKIIRTDRTVMRILRPDGRGRGTMSVSYDPRRQLTAFHAWSIPAQGKPYVVDDKQAMDTAMTSTLSGILMSDLRNRILQAPAEPGSIVAFEYVTEEDHPYVAADHWIVQDTQPVAEGHYSLQLPAGWQYKATWLNHDEVTPASSGPNQWQWTLSNVKPIRAELDMPPLRGIAGQLFVSFGPANGTRDDLNSWQGLGTWYLGLTQGRRDASADIKRRTAALTSASPATLDKIRALAAFVQTNIRYVGIELGTGDYQPHPAAEIYSHGYGDCKDKALLLSSMLHEIGVESDFVLVNTERGGVNANSPAHLGFNHVILAIQLPSNADDTTLLSVQNDAKIGRILYFDPTNPLTPLGRLDGQLQGGYGLLVTPDGGELVKLPQLAPQVSGIQRHMKMSLDESGNLQGSVEELLTGDVADEARERLRDGDPAATVQKLAEAQVADSLSRFQITQASVEGQDDINKAFVRHYSLQADRFAKAAGDLLLVRPRLLGVYSSALLETEKPRQNPIEFRYLMHASDEFEVTLPPGYIADEIPGPVDANYDFASYHSSSRVVGNVLHYTRTFDIKSLTVPVEEAEELRRFYRVIVADERQQATFRQGDP